MLRVRILDSNNNVVNEGVFADEAAVNDWYDFNKDFFVSPHTKVVTSTEDERVEALRDKESDEAVELGTKIIKNIRKINRRKLKLGLWTDTQFNALLASSTAAQIERALWNGSLTTAAYLLPNMSSFYSDLDIAPIVDMITAHEAKWSTLI
jgi:hypothetical protein